MILDHSPRTFQIKAHKQINNKILKFNRIKVMKLKKKKIIIIQKMVLIHKFRILMAFKSQKLWSLNNLNLIKMIKRKKSYLKKTYWIKNFKKINKSQKK